MTNNATILCDGIIYEHCNTFKCPVCGVGLWISKRNELAKNPLIAGIVETFAPITVFCGNGKCESQVTNDGAIEKDIESAISELEKMVEKEQAREYARATIMNDEEHAEFCIARNNLIKNDGLNDL